MRFSARVSYGHAHVLSPVEAVKVSGGTGRDISSSQAS